MCSPTGPSANKTTNYQQRTDPGSCVRVVYIAGDTLCHQPMGADHMTVLQLRGPMAFRVLQWCHPMLASLMEDKLLYPDDHLIWCSKVDSGPRISNCKRYLSYKFQIVQKSSECRVLENLDVHLQRTTSELELKSEKSKIGTFCLEFNGQVLVRQD